MKENERKMQKYVFKHINNDFNFLFRVNCCKFHWICGCNV